MGVDHLRVTNVRVSRFKDLKLITAIMKLLTKVANESLIRQS